MHEFQEGIFHDDQPGTQHYAQAPTFQGLQLPIRNISHQSSLHLHCKLSHQDILGITMDVLGLIVDAPCLSVHSLLY